MEMIEYEGFVRGRQAYPKSGTFQGLQYSILAMCGEAGETANVLKKVIRDHGSYISAEKRQELIHELGDVLWYITSAAAELGMSLSDVAQSNITKLTMRDLEREENAGT